MLMIFKLIFYYSLIYTTLAFIDPESLKGCFERYDEHKLLNAQPFHSEWRMADEGACLPFCAKATSRCRSIVYDKLGRICHYFMIDGIELEQVTTSRNMVYLQLADMECVSDALEREQPDFVPVTPETVQVSEGTGPGDVPILFAPENFPQPPSSGNVEENKPSTEHQQIDEPNKYETYQKKHKKFDEKEDKLGLDETVIYSDDGELINIKDDNTETDLSDVRITDDSDDYRKAKPQVIVTENVPKLDEEQKEYIDNVGSNKESIDYDSEKPEQTIEPPPIILETTTEEAVLVEKPIEKQVEEPVEVNTEDPKNAEILQIKQEMEKLEREIHEMKELEKQLKEKPAIFSMDSKQINPKLRLPKLPPSPTQIMEEISQSVVPELKGFKAQRKELSSIEDDIKASVDIRRHPVSDKKSSIKILGKEFVDSLNGEFNDEEDTGDSGSCSVESNIIWIAIENSDLPRIGKFVTKPADTTERCTTICKSLKIDGKYCNSFVFYEKNHECSFGYEEDIFSVKASKSNDFSTRAFKKLCYPESLSPFKDCEDFLGFRDYKLNIEPRETFDGLPNGRDGVSACVELCTLSNKFKCKSATFDFATGTCSIFDQDSLSASESFKEHRGDSLLYFENGCNIDISKSINLKGASIERVETSNKQRGEPVIIDYRTLKH